MKFGSGTNEYNVCEKIKATAALVPVPETVKALQPNKNEKKFPSDNRRYSYAPPDSSVSVARPERFKAQNMVMIPGSIHAINIQVSLKPVCAIGTIFLKTPEPIIMPTTSKVAVKRPSDLFKVGWFGDFILNLWFVF